MPPRAALAPSRGVTESTCCQPYTEYILSHVVRLFRIRDFRAASIGYAAIPVLTLSLLRPTAARSFDCDQPGLSSSSAAACWNAEESAARERAVRRQAQ